MSTRTVSFVRGERVRYTARMARVMSGPRHKVDWSTREGTVVSDTRFFCGGVRVLWDGNRVAVDEPRGILEKIAHDQATG